MSKGGRQIEVGEAWGIRIRQDPNAPWYDVCLILGVSDSTGNCVALSMMSGNFISDFSHDGLPGENDLGGWERIL